MNTAIKRIKNNTLLSILVALFLGIAVFYLSKYFSSLTSGFIKNNLDLDIALKGYINGLYTILLSLLIIWFVNNKSFKNYGFTWPKHINFFKMTLISLSIITDAILIGGILFMGILSHYFPSETSNTFPELTLLEQVLKIWIWASIYEEILARGLVQGFLNHLKNKKIIGLSIPVICSGIFFGALHLNTLTIGNPMMTGMIVFFTTIGGLVFAYYREKSESIFASMYLHFLANVTGAILTALVSQ